MGVPQPKTELERCWYSAGTDGRFHHASPLGALDQQPAETWADLLRRDAHISPGTLQPGQAHPAHCSRFGMITATLLWIASWHDRVPAGTLVPGVSVSIFTATKSSTHRRQTCAWPSSALGQTARSPSLQQTQATCDPFPIGLVPQTTALKQRLRPTAAGGCIPVAREVR